MIHELSTRPYLWLVRRFEGVESNETTVEHTAIELAHEGDHVIHLAGPVAHSATEGALGALGTVGAILAALQQELWESVGWIGSVLYIGQLITQARLYGVRTWWHYGLGTGVPLRKEDTS